MFCMHCISIWSYFVHKMCTHLNDTQQQWTAMNRKGSSCEIAGGEPATANNNKIKQKERDMPPGPCLNIKTIFPRYGDSHVKIRRSRDRLIFNMGISILVRRHLYIETALWWPWTSGTISSLSSHCNSFDDQVPVDEIYNYPNFK